MDRSSSFFQGTELPRLLVLVAIAAFGWGAVWWYAHTPVPVAEPPLAAAANPPQVEPDQSPEFAAVTDRTPLSLTDNGAYSLLLDRARARTPNELASISRRDVILPHLWNDPARYRGIPIHLLGTALRVIRYPSKLSKTGWLYEASIITPETSRVPYICVFEDAPTGLPIGANVSERVVFNGYFLKIWRYQAGDAVRGAPLLVGRLGWSPSEPGPGTGDFTLKLSLIVVALFFVISFLRWGYQLSKLFISPTRRKEAAPQTPPAESIAPDALAAWLQSESQAAQESPAAEEPRPGEPDPAAES